MLYEEAICSFLIYGSETWDLHDDKACRLSQNQWYIIECNTRRNYWQNDKTIRWGHVQLQCGKENLFSQTKMTRTHLTSRGRQPHVSSSDDATPNEQSGKPPHGCSTRLKYPRTFSGYQNAYRSTWRYLVTAKVIHDPQIGISNWTNVK